MVSFKTAPPPFYTHHYSVMFGTDGLYWGENCHFWLVGLFLAPNSSLWRLSTLGNKYGIIFATCAVRLILWQYQSHVSGCRVETRCETLKPHPPKHMTEKIPPTKTVHLKHPLRSRSAPRQPVYSETCTLSKFLQKLNETRYSTHCRDATNCYVIRLHSK